MSPSPMRTMRGPTDEGREGREGREKRGGRRGEGGRVGRIVREQGGSRSVVSREHVDEMVPHGIRRASRLPTMRGSDRGSDRGSNRGSDRGSDRGISKGSRRPVRLQGTMGAERGMSCDSHVQM